MKKNEKIILGAACFLAGAVVGALIAPVLKETYYAYMEEEATSEDVENMDEIDKTLDEVNEDVNEEVNEEVNDSMDERYISSIDLVEK